MALVLVAGIPPGPVPAPAGALAGRPEGPLVPQTGFYVGAYTKHPEGYGIDRRQAAIHDMERRLGRRLHIDHHFYAWDKEFPTWRETWDLEHGRIPMISWNGADVHATSIWQGAHDGLITKRADAVKALGEPVFLRWFWEMDGNKKAEWAQGPENYVKAWRHIVDLFRQRGATNAVWVWCPNASAVGNRTALPFYPGSDYVDWVCGDGYNFAPNRPGDRWREFEEIFEGFYREGLKLHKPLMIGEFGVLEREPGEKQRWFHHAHDVIARRFPAIAALVYFNADSTTGGVYFDWRVDTSPESFEGFRYLFTGPPPIPRPMSPPPPGPAPQPPPPATAAPPAPPPAPGSPAAPRPPRAAPSPTPAPPPATTTAAPPAPTLRLEWVLSLLRHLDATTVPPASGPVAAPRARRVTR